ncbi:MAG: DUF4350 domain-containing protein [Actinomycetota bacterium]
MSTSRPSTRGSKEGGARIPAAWRWIIGILAVVVAINALLGLLDSAFGGPGGPRSSSYATAPEGVAAYAELLAHSGYPVTPVRGEIADATVAPGATMFVLDPGALPPDDLDALKDHVRAGGTLVIGGGAPGWARELFEREPDWTPSGAIAAEALAPVPETNGVMRVRAAGEGNWSDPGGGLPVLGTSGMTLAIVGVLGEGRVVALADASPLQNRFLDRADNAAFGLALAGDRGTPAYFAEGVHGYGTSTGIGAIPTRWKWTLGYLTIAALLWMVAIGRRLGPPEEQARMLPPPRRAYVDALATTLARTKRRGDAVAPVRAEVRAALARRAGIPTDADERALRGAASVYGLDGDEIKAIFQPDDSERDVLAAGRALAKLSGGSKW